MSDKETITIHPFQEAAMKFKDDMAGNYIGESFDDHIVRALRSAISYGYSKGREDEHLLKKMMREEYDNIPHTCIHTGEKNP